MVLSLKRLLALPLLALLILGFQPSLAHPEHNKQREAAEQNQIDGNGAIHGPSAMPGMTGDDDGMMMDERPTTFTGRLARWLGAMHPFAVHFPIALIPASWLALLIARRRGHGVDVIRAVIILAGVAAIGATLLGWLNGGFALADSDPFKLAHRWIGTLLALVVGGIGLWAWRRPLSVNSPAMAWTLGGTTLLLLVQGWLGAVLTHGLDHMSF